MTLDEVRKKYENGINPVHVKHISESLIRIVGVEGEFYYMFTYLQTNGSWALNSYNGSLTAPEMIGVLL